MLNGPGKLERWNGETFEGFFLNGKRHGQGRYKKNKGEYLGCWKNDLLKEGIFTNEEFYYKGGFKNKKFFGKGVLNNL